MKRALLLSTLLLCGFATVHLSRAQAPQRPLRGGNNTARAETSTMVRPYQNLWIPPVLTGRTFYLSLGKAKKSFWAGATTPTYCYNDTGFWGPTLILEQGDAVQIRVKNTLDEVTTVHWHGLHLPAIMDGGPHQPIEPGATWTSSFIVKNNASTYWYHPHPHEATQKQLTLGAGGFIIIRDPIEAKLALPRTYGVDDLPLVLTSRRFKTDDQFSYEGDRDKYGDFLFANGTLDPQVSLPAQFVRLRILNAEVERGYDLGFRDGRKFYVIATDGGLVDKPIAVTRLKLMVGERVEILVDLTADKAGSNVDLMSYNGGQQFGYPGGEPGRIAPNGSYLNALDFQVLHIKVAAPTVPRITKLPEVLTHNNFPAESEISNRRTIRFSKVGFGDKEFAFDGKYFDMHTVNHVVKLGATEAWTLTNDRTFGHSFHIHDVQFKIIARTGTPLEDYEQGWKDTFYVPRNTSVTFLARFDDYASDTDAFMYHCHMSNHEDGGLMGQFLVSKDPAALKKDAKGAVQLRARVEHPLTPTMIDAAARQAKTRAPAFESADLDGRPLSLAALTTGKPLVLFFIESDCPCSQEAAPFLDRLQAVYGEGCTVVGVINVGPDAARAWVAKVGVQFPIIADPELQIIHAYRAERSVYTTLVAPGGAIVKTYPGYSAEMLTELAASVARVGEFPAQSFLLAEAPQKFVAGCPFPSLR